MELDAEQVSKLRELRDMLMDTTRGNPYFKSKIRKFIMNSNLDVGRRGEPYLVDDMPRGDGLITPPEERALVARIDYLLRQHQQTNLGDLNVIRATDPSISDMIARMRERGGLRGITLPFAPPPTTSLPILPRPTRSVPQIPQVGRGSGGTGL